APGYGGQGFGYPSFGGYAAQAPAAGPVGAGQPPASAAAAPGTDINGTPAVAPPRIVPNPLDNGLLIQANPQQYQNILRLLKELDVPPRQILLEAKIYEVDLGGAFASGITAYFQQASGASKAT